MSATETSAATAARFGDRKLPAALTVGETAERLHLSIASVYRRIDDGSLRAVKIGGCVRVPLDALEDLLRGPEEP